MDGGKGKEKVVFGEFPGEKTGTARDAQDRGAARQRTGHRPAPGAIAE